jgi:hypothetical protein
MVELVNLESAAWLLARKLDPQWAAFATETAELITIQGYAGEWFAWERAGCPQDENDFAIL